jgi:hypothetical protein
VSRSGRRVKRLRLQQAISAKRFFLQTIRTDPIDVDILAIVIRTFTRYKSRQLVIAGRYFFAIGVTFQAVEIDGSAGQVSLQEYNLAMFPLSRAALNRDLLASRKQRTDSNQSKQNQNFITSHVAPLLTSPCSISALSIPSFSI